MTPEEIRVQFVQRAIQRHLLERHVPPHPVCRSCLVEEAVHTAIAAGIDDTTFPQQKAGTPDAVR